MLKQNKTLPPKAVIAGFSGKELTPEEQSFFSKNNPLGFILFGRNIEDKAQVKRLVRSLKECVQREDVPILIDQEGGRVARLKKPHFRGAPPAGVFASIAKFSPETAKEGVYLNALLMAKELHELGITVDCAPVADVPVPGAHDIIGDRAYGNTPEKVTYLARAVAEGLLQGGIIPIMKHIPGHGRAYADSHEDLPVVDASKKTLEQWDFATFKALADIPWAMTAHILYTALDAKRPATLSPDVIEMIRHDIGFNGVLISDDLSMKALKGSFADRTQSALNAGCDIVLHCNGEMQEMEEIMAHATFLSDQAITRLEAGKKRLQHENMPDVMSMEARLGDILKQVA